MRGKRAEIERKWRLRERYDVSQGILVSNKLVSICFDCGRSGAPLGLRCSWDEGLVLPKGAVYCKKCLKISNDDANEQLVRVKNLLQAGLNHDVLAIIMQKLLNSQH